MVEHFLRGRRVLTQEGLGPRAIGIAAGCVTDVRPYEAVPPGAPVVEARGVLMPGLVDSHVHVNEPGRTEWEGFASATRAAAAGGITTIIDMPLNSVPPVTTVAGLVAKREAASGQCWVDVGFWGGVVPGNAGEIEPMLAAGAAGFKCFLVPSGVDEFPHVEESSLRPALEILANGRAPLLVHAELPGPIEAAERAAASASPLRYLTYLASRPARAEEEAIILMIRASRPWRPRTSRGTRR